MAKSQFNRKALIEHLPQTNSAKIDANKRKAVNFHKGKKGHWPQNFGSNKHPPERRPLEMITMPLLYPTLSTTTVNRLIENLGARSQAKALPSPFKSLMHLLSHRTHNNRIKRAPWMRTMKYDLADAKPSRSDLQLEEDS